MLRLSFLNLASGFTLTSGTAVDNYNAANLSSPQRPFLPLKLTDASGFSVDITLSAAVDFVALIRATFPAATLAGTPITLLPSWNTRYHYALDVATSGTVALSVPAGTPNDDLPEFRLGGVWAGTWTIPPKGFELGDSWEMMLPASDEGPSHKGWEQRIYEGDPIVQASGNIRLGTATPPGLNDRLATWRQIQRSMILRDIFLVQPDHRDPYQVFVMRTADPKFKWTHGSAQAPEVAEGNFTLKEVVGGS